METVATQGENLQRRYVVADKKKRTILMSEDKGEEYKPSWAKRAKKAIKAKTKLRPGSMKYKATDVDSFKAGRLTTPKSGRSYFGAAYERKF